MIMMMMISSIGRYLTSEAAYPASTELHPQRRVRPALQRGERDWGASARCLPPSEENLMNERVPHSLLTGEQP